MNRVSMMTATAGSSFGTHVATLVLCASAVAGLGLLSLFGVSAHAPGPLWIAVAVIAAGLIRWQLLRGAALAGAALGSLAVYLVHGVPVLPAVVLAGANLAAVAAAFVLFERLQRRGRALFAPASIGIMLAVSLIAPVAATLVASLVVGYAPLSLLPWYAATGCGLMIFGPLVLAGGCQDCLALARSKRIWEVAGVVLGAGGVTLAVFSQGYLPILFLPLPVVTAAVFRLRFIGAAMSAAVIASVTLIQTATGHGPVATLLPDVTQQALFLQAYIAVIVMSGMPVAAILVDRERMSRSVVDSEARFRSMASIAPVAMFRTDEEGRIVYQNVRWQEMVGDWLGRQWTDVAAAELRDDLSAAWHRARAAGAKLLGEYDFARANGDVGYVSLAIAAERGSAGAISAWIGVAVDIEEQRYAAAKVEHSERQFRLLAESTNDMIVRLSLDGIRRYVSPACRTILGFEPDELVGETPIAAIHAEDRARVERVCRGLLEGARDPVCSYRQRRRDGSYAWLEATYRLIRDDDGQPFEFIASVRDIGRRRSAELEATSALARLEESHRLLQMAEGLAGVGHWRLDAKTLDVFWSDEVYQIHGRAIGDTPPLDQAIEVYHEDDRATVQRLVDAALTRGEDWTFKARIYRPDGELRHVESSGRAERAPDGSVVGVVGVFRDITDQVLAEAELVRARDEARASAEAKSAFLATMSHEIRTPMTGVLGMIELLRTDLTPEDRTRFFDNLEQSASLLMTVLDDVLDFSKIEARNLILERVDFDMVELARNTLDLFHHAASKKGLLLSLAAPIGRDAMVKGDPVRLQQVMSNLISNAIKFTQRGKVELRLGVEGTERKRIITCEVADTGIGIAPAALDGLFDPFVQADISTTRRFGGTGLGLAISKRLVEAMHGTIAVESEEGEGTTFRFAVTLEAGSRDVRTKAARGIGATRQLAVLLAEDNQINRALVEAIVRRGGHTIRSVENGRLAVEAAEAAAYDVILMDMQMPEMDGLAATREIRKGQGPCRDVPIIALTADASAERRRFYDNVGLTEFLTKPVDTDLLTERLQLIASGDRTVGPLDDPASGPSEALINEEQLADLERAIGAAAVNHLLDMLTDELKARPLLIRDMVARQSLKVVVVEAHALKGATLNIGAERVGQLARRIEEACGAGSVPEALGDELVDAARATRIALDNRKKGVSRG